MASRDLNVRIDGDASGFDKAAKSAQQSARVFEKELKALEAQQKKQHEAMSGLGRGMMVAGAAMAAGLGLATKAAMDWESAWAGVTKTVGGNDQQMAALEGGLRDLAKTLPATHDEIAGVAEAAGQLGVQRDAILGFTETMVALGETTNLSALDASTSVAQLANIMGTDLRAEVDNFGATLVALGNAGASTERDIMDMALRLGGAGAMIGATEADVLALSNAMASMGIEAELGGGAMSRVILKMYEAVREGGDSLAGFAEISGVTSQQFADDFGSKPIATIDAFVRGLDGIDKSGGNVVAALADVGIRGTQNLQVLLRLKGAGDLLTDSLLLGAQAWEQNSALTEEANKRYATTESQMKVARNALNDMAIDLGAVLLPALANAAGALSDFAGFLGDLPDSLQAGLVILGTLGASVGLLGGAALIAIPKIVALEAQLVLLGISAGTASKMMGLLYAGMATAGIATAVAGIVVGVDMLTKVFADAPPKVADLKSSLVQFGETGKTTGALLSVVGQDFASLGDQIDKASRSKWFDFSGASAVEIQEARESIEALDQALAALVTSGNADVAAKAMLELKASSDLSDADIVGTFDAYGEALAGVESAASPAAAATSEVGNAAKTAADDMQAFVDALSEQADALRAQYDPIFAMQQAISAQAEAQAALTEATKEHGGSSKEAADAQWALFESTVGLSAASSALTAAVAGGTVSFDQATAQLDEWVAQGLMTSDQAASTAAQIQALTGRAQELSGTPANVDVTTSGIEAAMSQVSRLTQYLNGLPGSKTVTVRYNEVLGATVQRGAPGRLIERAEGGILPGAPSSRDNMIIAAASGEFVVNAAQTARYLPLLESINSGRLIKRERGGRIPGGAVSASDPRSLTTAVNAVAFMDTGEMQRLIDSWKAYNDELEQAARLRELLADEANARADIAAAKTAEESARAYEALNSAMQATTDFQYAAARQAELDAAERLLAVTEAQIDANRRANVERREQQDNRYAVGDMGDAEYLEILARRMDDEQKYSDAWTALWRERESILKQQADAERDLTDAIAAELDRRADAQADAFDRLNSLLDAEASVQARQVQAEATYYTRRAALGRSFNDEQQRILNTRRDMLTSWARIDEVSSPAWGNTVEQLAGNAAAQNAQLAEWMDALADARADGVSEGVIGALGLDQGPQALGQLRQFSNATVAEIAALNDEVSRRTSLASQQVRREQMSTYTALGRELAQARATYQAEVRALEAEFLAEQQALADEMAQIGQDQGRSFTEALAASILSGIPAIQAAAAAARAAMTDLAAASAVTGSTNALPGGSGSPFKRGGTYRTSDTTVMQTASAPKVESHTYVVLDGKVVQHEVNTVLGAQRNDFLIGGSRG